jgi:hypothetical protein
MSKINLIKGELIPLIHTNNPVEETQLPDNQSVSLSENVLCREVTEIWQV